MKKTQITAIKRIINNNPNRTALQGIFTDAAGRVCACDGFRAIRLTYHNPEELPTAAGLDIQRFFDVARGWDLAPPTVDELKAIIKAANDAKQKIAVYDFGEDLPHVNARYLLDMLRIFPDAKIYRTANNPKNKAIFFDSPLGDGLLMPLYKK